jgi:hypothetical protein
MKMIATFLLCTGLLFLTLPGFADPVSNAGVTRTEIEGSDNWGWRDFPLSQGTITCPGGELMLDAFGLPYCANSTTNRLHFRDTVVWSCMTTNDPRTTGVAVFEAKGTLDADSSGPGWGTWKIVPMEDCDKDGFYPEEVVETSTTFWRGIWNGKRLFYSMMGFDVWIGDFRIVGKGIGGDIDGLHFEGTELIQTYTPFPVSYELLPSELGLFDVPEGYFTGTITD